MIEDAEKSCERIVALISELSEIARLDAGSAATRIDCRLAADNDHRDHRGHRGHVQHGGRVWSPAVGTPGDAARRAAMTIPLT